MKIPDLKLGDEKSVKDNGTADLETAIRLTGFGKFHVLLIAICGYSFFTSGLEYGLHAYTLPYAQCDLNLTTAQMGLINAMFLAGSITCSIVCGSIADTVGRKRVITTSLLVGGVSTFLASFSPNLTLFVIIRFVSGFMSGAPGCLLFSYAGEFCSDRYRSRAICIIGFCWTLAWLFLPTMSWLIVSSNISFSTPLYQYNAWRLFVSMVGGMPGLISGLLIAYLLPETPKFLYVTARQNEALEILRMVYHKNTGNLPENYPVKKIVATHNSEAEQIADIVDDPEKAKSKSFKEVLLLMVGQVKQILNPPHNRRALLISSIYFTNFFGYYGLGLWLPELFNRFQAYYAAYPEDTITVCELSQYNNFSAAKIDMNETSLSDLITCENRSVNLAVFSNTFIIGASCSFGNIIAILLTNKVGGRILSLCAMLVSGICSAIVYFSRSELQIVIVSCIFMTGVGTAMTTIGTCIVNLFPTSVRAAGVCLGILCGRLGAISSNLIFGLLLDISCEVPFFFLGGTIILGACLCYLLPKESQKAVEE